MEKGYLHWKADILTEFDPYETGLARFVKTDKAFLGQEALELRRHDGPTKQIVTLSIDTTDAPAHPGASLMQGDKVVGTITSGDWGHRTGLNLAYAFVDPEMAKLGTTIDLDLLGSLVPATVIAPCPYDPDTTLPRG